MIVSVSVNLLHYCVERELGREREEGGREEGREGRKGGWEGGR